MDERTRQLTTVRPQIPFKVRVDQRRFVTRRTRQVKGTAPRNGPEQWLRWPTGSHLPAWDRCPKGAAHSI